MQYTNIYQEDGHIMLVCASCGIGTEVVSVDEFADMLAYGWGGTELCLNCASKQGVGNVDTPFFLAQKGDYLTFLECVDTYHNDDYATDTGYTDLYITEAKIITIKVTDGSSF